MMKIKADVWAYVVLLIGVYALSVFILSFDKDVHSVFDFLHWGPMIVVSYYALPAFVFAALMFRLLGSGFTTLERLIVSLIVGVPGGVIGVVVLLNSIL